MFENGCGREKGTWIKGDLRRKKRSVKQQKDVV